MTYVEAFQNANPGLLKQGESSKETPAMAALKGGIMGAGINKLFASRTKAKNKHEFNKNLATVGGALAGGALGVGGSELLRALLPGGSSKVWRVLSDLILGGAGAAGGAYAGRYLGEKYG